MINRKIRLPVDTISQLQIVLTKVIEWWNNNSSAVMGRWQIYFYHEKLFFPKINVTAKKSGRQTALCVAMETLSMMLPIWVRLANQLRPSHLPMIKSNDTVIPLNILLDTLELLQSFQAKPNKKTETQRKVSMRKAYPKCKLNTYLRVDPRQTYFI